jgi:hypothetical protein
MTVFPDIQRKLRKHILESMPELQDRPPTLEDLTPGKLPYLEAVVQETLRLSRTAGGYSRDGMFSPPLRISIECMTLKVSHQGYYNSRPLCPKGNHDCYDDKYGL